MNGGSRRVSGGRGGRGEGRGREGGGKGEGRGWRAKRGLGSWRYGSTPYGNASTR